MPELTTTIRHTICIFSRGFRTLIVIFLLLLPFNGKSQGHPARNVVWDLKLERQVSFLSDDICAGRAAGTKGGTEAAAFIARRFSEIGLEPLHGGESHKSHFQSFLTPNGVAGHNVIGFFNGSRKLKECRYLIVGAHFDNLGTMGGKIYRGADANASGVVAEMSVAEMLVMAKLLGKSYSRSVIFVAFDARNNGMAGSQAFWKCLGDGMFKDPHTGKTIWPEAVDMMVDLDQLGSTMAPVEKNRPDYLLAVDNGTLSDKDRDLIDWTNRIFDLNLQVCHDYYGSENFTKVFFKITDVKPFADDGIPCVMFTSGITMNNNKPYDSADTLDYPVFRTRIYLIFHWIEILARH
ncbi:MAG: M28 family peptidase [Candidatus Cryptobacteroides sp.]